MARRSLPTRCGACGVRSPSATRPLSSGREHNNANVLSLGARMYDEDTAVRFAQIFLSTPFSEAERHVRRLALVANYEESGVSAAGARGGRGRRPVGHDQFALGRFEVGFGRSGDVASSHRCRRADQRGGVRRAWQRRHLPTLGPAATGRLPTSVAMLWGSGTTSGGVHLFVPAPGWACLPRRSRSEASGSPCWACSSSPGSAWS